MNCLHDWVLSDSCSGWHLPHTNWTVTKACKAGLLTRAQSGIHWLLVAQTGRHTKQRVGLRNPWGSPPSSFSTSKRRPGRPPCSCVFRATAGRQRSVLGIERTAGDRGPAGWPGVLSPMRHTHEIALCDSKGGWPGSFLQRQAGADPKISLKASTRI